MREAALGAAGSAVGAGSALLTGEDPEEVQRRAEAGFAIGAGSGLLSRKLLKPVTVARTTADAHKELITLTDELRTAADRVTNATTAKRGVMQARNLVSMASQSGEVVRRLGNQLDETITTGLANGDIAPLPHWQTQEAAWRAAVAPERANGLDELLSSPAHVRENWTAGGVPNYRVRAGSEAEQALKAAEDFFGRQQGVEIAVGAGPKSSVENYVPHHYASGPKVNTPTSQPVKFSLGAKQAFEKGRTYPRLVDAYLDGYTPTTLDLGDLMQYRMQAGAKAIADRQELNLLKANGSNGSGTGWIEWNADAARKAGNYRPRDILRMVYPQMDALEAEKWIDDAVTGAVTTREARLGIQNNAITAGQRQPWVRDDVWNALNAQHGRSAEGMETLLRPLEAAKQGRLSWDISQTLRIMPQMFVDALVSPAHAVTPVAKAFLVSLRPGAFEEMLHDPKARDAMYWLHAGSRDTENEILGRAVSDQPLEQLARSGAEALGRRNAAAGRVAGVAATGVEKGLSPAKKLEDWQFNRLSPALRAFNFIAIEDALRKLPKYAALSEEDLKTMVANHVNRTAGVTDFVQMGSGPLRKDVERILLLSPSQTYASLGLARDVVKNDVEGMLARRFWTGTALAALASGVAGTLAFSDDRSPEHLALLLDPRDPESLTNPLNGRFGSVVLPDGTTINTWGPAKPIFKAILTPVKKTADAAAKAQEQGMQAAIAAGLAAATGESFESVKDYLWGRKSIAVGIVDPLKTNRDGRDLPIATAENEWARVGQKAAYLLAQSVPGPFSSWADTDITPVPQGVQNPRSVALRAAGNFLGANVNVPSQDPASAKQAATAFLKEQGLHPGEDPVGAYRRAKAQDEVGGVPLAQFRASPAGQQLEGYIAQKRSARDAAGIDIPVGKDAVRSYQAVTNNERIRRDAAIKALGEQGLSGNAYRAALEDIWDRYLGAAEGEARRLRLGDDLGAAEAKVKQIGGQEGGRRNRTDALVEQYMAIRVKPGAGRSERDAALEARRTFVEGLSAGDRSDFLSQRRAQAEAIGGGEYARYFDAQQLIGEYMSIPQYLGPNAQDGRVVGELIDRSRQFARFYPPGSGMALVGLLYDPQFRNADGRVKAYAIAAAQGGLQRNPLRSIYWQTHPELGRFYSDLADEQMELIAG